MRRRGSRSWSLANSSYVCMALSNAPGDPAALDVVTAPLHGFDGAEDYWRRASAKPHLDAIRVPALMLNARNDPIVPDASLPRAHEVGSHLTLWQPHDGGHVGFVAGRWPGHVHAMPDAVCDWLAQAG